MQNAVKIDSGTVTLRPDGIIHITLKEDYTLDVADVKQMNEAIATINEGGKSLVLTSGGKFTSFSAEAIADSLNPENFKYTIADAFVIQSLHQRILANFYITVIKPPVPTKYFEKEEKAIEWLLSIKKA